MPSNWDGEFLNIKGDNVNVRSEPSISVGVVKFQLFDNHQVEVIAKTTEKYIVDGYGKDFWYYIKSGEDQGWVFGKLTDF